MAKRAAQEGERGSFISRVFLWAQWEGEETSGAAGSVVASAEQNVLEQSIRRNEVLAAAPRTPSESYLIRHASHEP